MQQLNTFLYSDFIFSPTYRVWRHVIYWSFHITVWAAFWVIMGAPSFGRQLFNMSLWVPVFILFSYPLVYGAIPHLLLKGKVTLFFLLVLAWGGVGLFIDNGFRSYMFIPLQEAMGLDNILPPGPLPSCYLCMTTSAASPMIIKFFKLCTLKQREWMLTQKEKLTAELQLLKAQVHPYFLFNTLNNIYSFSLDQSPKTPGLILKLSSLLSYMLYDCNAEQVRLEKEIEVMKNYIDLEKERCDNKLEISWSVEGNVRDQFISPLLMMPFLENAFKHGVSEQIENPWLSIDISVKSDILRCKIANSKNEFAPPCEIGIGITNVKKRLEVLYPGKYELKISDEGNFFVISLMLKLTDIAPADLERSAPIINAQRLRNEMPLPVLDDAQAVFKNVST
jgi:two-component system, LytTR family, sensor histidine kinase AlgZ